MWNACLSNDMPGLEIEGMIPNLKVDLLEPVLCQGYPRADDFQALDRLADTVAKRHRELGLVR